MFRIGIVAYVRDVNEFDFDTAGNFAEGVISPGTGVTESAIPRAIVTFELLML